MAMEGLNYYTKDEINELRGTSSDTSIFMRKSTYDSNGNGIVDNAEKVNGHTVLTDVPANAVYTDTTYTAGTGIAINNGVISCILAPMPKDTNFYGSDSDLYDFLCAIDMSATAARTHFVSMFEYCIGLTRVPLFDTSSGLYMQYMFHGCTALTSVPQFNTSSVTLCNYMFDGCTALTSVPQFDLSSCEDPGAMFHGCSSLVTVPQFDFSKVTSFGGLLSATKIFGGCTSLSNDSLNNILASLTSATSYTGTKTLKYLGLTSAQASTCTGLSNYAAFTAAGWSTGY